MPSLRDRTMPNVLMKLSRVPGAGMMHILPGHTLREILIRCHLTTHYPHPFRS